MHGFIRDAAGVVTTFDPPGAATDTAFGINDHGQIAGQWSPDTTGNIQHAFIRNADGTFFSFDAPNSDVTGAFGINDAGQMTVNALKEPGPYRSFLRNADGTYSGIAVPGAASWLLQGLNNNGIAVGAALTNSLPAFEALMNGAIVAFDVPGSTPATTSAYGINDDNAIVGTYNLGAGYDQVTHGYIREPGGSIVAFDIPNAASTVLYGINDAGQIVGSFSDVNGIHGFIATPCRQQRSAREGSGTAAVFPAGSCGSAMTRRPVRR